MTDLFVQTPQYYNVPNLALGERLVKPTDENVDANPELAALPDYKLYQVDTKGDQDVRMYGRLYRGSIPKYRRIGCKGVSPQYTGSIAYINRLQSAT